MSCLKFKHLITTVYLVLSRFSVKSQNAETTATTDSDSNSEFETVTPAFDYDDYKEFLESIPKFNYTADDYVSSQARCENLVETFECLNLAKKYDLEKEKYLKSNRSKEWYAINPDDCFRPQWTMFACWRATKNTPVTTTSYGNKIYHVNITWPKSAPAECWHETEAKWRRDCQVKNDSSNSVEWLHDMETFIQYCPENENKVLTRNETETVRIHNAQELWFNFDRVLRIIQTVLTFSAFGLMLFLKRIHCTRIYIHMHLLLSFILRSILFSLYQSDINPDIVQKRNHRAQAEFLDSIPENDTILMNFHPLVQRNTELLHHAIWQYHPTSEFEGNQFLYDNQTGNWNEPEIQKITHMLTNHCSLTNEYQTSFVPCKIVAVLLQYFVTANFCWLLVEGIYLSLLLQTSSVTSKFTITPFAILGWGVPWLSIIVWTCVMWLTDPGKVILDENTYFKMGSCWLEQASSSFLHQRKFQWLIQIPIFITLGLNVYIFISVVSVVNIKLRASNTDYKIRLARSTLSLIPLLGIQYGLTVWMEDLSWEDSEIGYEWLMVQFFLKSIFNRLPGILVALIYCFFNSEVQTEFVARLRAFNLGREVEMDAYRRRSTISNSNISNQIGGPKTSLSEMSGTMIPPHNDLSRRKSSIFVETSMWFKSYFVKPRNQENRFAMQRRASALNSHLSSSKHSLNGGTLTRGNNSINSTNMNLNSGTLITSDHQYNVHTPKTSMNRLHSTSSPSYQIGSRSSPNVLNKNNNNTNINVDENTPLNLEKQPEENQNEENQ